MDKLKRRELIMLIVALEWWKGRPKGKLPQGLEHHFTHFPPLSEPEIDTLIRRLKATAIHNNQQEEESHVI